jgi:hypothetical protein
VVTQSHDDSLIRQEREKAGKTALTINSRQAALTAKRSPASDMLQRRKGLSGSHPPSTSKQEPISTLKGSYYQSHPEVGAITFSNERDIMQYRLSFRGLALEGTLLKSATLCLSVTLARNVCSGKNLIGSCSRRACAAVAGETSDNSERGKATGLELLSNHGCFSILRLILHFTDTLPYF